MKACKLYENAVFNCGLKFQMSWLVSNSSKRELVTKFIPGIHQNNQPILGGEENS